MPTREKVVEPVAPGDNVAYLAGPRRLISMLAAALGSGLLLTVAYAPLELDVAAWFALCPILLAPVSRRWRIRILIGLLFGFTHTVTNLFWLNEVGFGAGVLLAVYCAVFPAAWYLFSALITNPPWALRPPHHAADTLRPAQAISRLEASPLRLMILTLELAALWVALEWVQSWLFTGFPWNQLAITQWRHTQLLTLTRFTGVYGLSFVIVAANIGLARVIGDRSGRWIRGEKTGISWPAVTAAAVMCVALGITWLAESPPVPDTHLKIIGVQGHIPQCRDFTEEQLDDALTVYRDLTLAAAGTPGLDLVVWPESAVPAALLWDSKAGGVLSEVLSALDCPLLAGSVQYAPATNPDDENDFIMFNSALLFSADDKLVQVYHKIRRVPFGEYVPFGDYLPWLVTAIGMGRDLTPGKEFTVFDLGRGVHAGVNICFEDAFPDISREFTKRGANLLITVTNDAWYAESAGSRQHMLHAVFRAVENARPLFRAGNNSDTCLITPDGKIHGALVDPVTGNRFVRGFQSYKVPVATEAPLTFYTRYGDVFAKLCAAAAAVSLLRLLVRWLTRKRQLANLFAAD
ncbi:MAG: apolipoprotein N-acyltransferase [Lentisphaeria bacterium]|nr:apolipoprotein N-acyltransferase [Lentisphaeria bacterium]